MKNNHKILIVKTIAIILLIWALTDNPYSYYQILRWVITGIAGYLTYSAYKGENSIWAWILGIVVILYNPIAPIYFGRETWIIVDLITAIIFFVSIFKVKAIKEPLKTQK